MLCYSTVMRHAITFDDVCLLPRYSMVLPHQVDTSTRLTRTRRMRIPLLSAAMDTVTESQTAIVMAQQGGIGVIHRNLSVEEQVAEVRTVKKYESVIISQPIVVPLGTPIADAKALMKRFNISGIPVIDDEMHLLGIVTIRDLRFEDDTGQLVDQMMTPMPLVTASVGTNMKQASALLQGNRIEKLPIVDADNVLKGLITVKDIEKSIIHPSAYKDTHGRLCVAAAIGTGDNEWKRAQALHDADVDVLVIDTAHAHSEPVGTMISRIKDRWGDAMEVIAGNVATADGCAYLIEKGVDGVKVGVGAGSICTTRMVAGVGVPQLQAILNCASLCRDHGVPLIADGGIKYSGDVVKALAAGADSVMIGSLFAGTDEAPGETILYNGVGYKTYYGMGSLAAMQKGSKDRYNQGNVREPSKLVPEGVEGRIVARGRLDVNIHQLLGGLRAGMGYIGAATIETLYGTAEFVQVSSSALRESHPHDVIITKEPPNYRSPLIN